MVESQRLHFHESLSKHYYIYIIWVSLILLTLLIYYKYVGFKTKFTAIIAAIMVIILISNMFFSAVDRIDSYAIEARIYADVEQNARAFLPFGIALAALVLATGNKKKTIINNKNFLYPLLISTACFVFVLTIIWVPKESGVPTRIMRDIKTVLIILGGTMIVVLIGEFVTLYLQ